MIKGNNENINEYIMLDYNGGEKVLGNTALKSFKEAPINYNSHAASKIFFWILCCWIDVLWVQSKKNNCENLTLFMGEFKSEVF